MLHLDSGSIIKHQRTADGFLRAYVRAARVGELKYRNADGTTRTEVVSREELFRSDSTDSLKMLPVTYPHPPGRVTPDNARQYQRGSTGHLIVADGDFLGLVTSVTDRETIEAITSGRANGASLGYDVDPVPRKDGKINQTNRRGNHLAAVEIPRAKGAAFLIDFDDFRADSDDEEFWIQQLDLEAYKCDSDDEYIDTLLSNLSLDGKQIIRKTPVILPNSMTQTPTTQIPIGKRIYTVDGKDATALADAVAQLQTNLDASQDAVKTAQTERDDHKRRADEAEGAKVAAEEVKARLDGELDATKTKLQDAESSRKDGDTIGAEVEARLNTWSLVLPSLRKDSSDFKPNYKLDSIGIKRLYLENKAPHLKEKLQNADAAYIEASWDILKPSPQTDGIDSTGDLLTVVNQSRQDAVSQSHSNQETKINRDRPLPGTKS